MDIYENITLLIKAFERPKSLIRLIKSIARYYPNIHILVIDDSKDALDIKALTSIHNNLTYVYAGYDIGLSAGRNLGISKISTKYFVLLDDDFYFTKKTNLFTLLNTIENNNFDIVGFDFYDYGLCKRNFQGIYEVKDNVLISKIQEYKEIKSGYKMYDYVLNCFIGRTELFKSNQWDDYIKIGSEHDDFFYNLMAVKPKITHDTSVSIMHFPEYSKDYDIHRKGRFDFYYKYFLNKNGLKSFEKTGNVYSVFDLLIIKLLAIRAKIQKFF